MSNLSPAYHKIKALRSSGDCAAAISIMRSSSPASDEDAFEALVCLFVCGDLASALNVCRTYGWQQDWARSITGAFSERLSGGDSARALSLARSAVSSASAPSDASAIYLLLLQENSLIDEADAYVSRRFPNPPSGESFLLTTIAEISIAAENWRQAYRSAAAVLATDPDDYRALLASSVANFKVGNIHEALGNATRANFVDNGGPQALLQIMRCENALGDYYGALAAFEKLTDTAAIDAEMHVQLGTAYAGLNDRERAIVEYQAALASESPHPDALRAVIAIHSAQNDHASLDALVQRFSAAVYADIECVNTLALDALNRRALDRASDLFRSAFALAVNGSQALHDLPWPITESRIRHDYEQLLLLQHRGKLDDKGRAALKVLEQYCDRTSDCNATFAPTGREAQSLKDALCKIWYTPEVSFSGAALGENDYAALEQQYHREKLVVIDDFLSPAALAALRSFCEEATVWKINNQRGYVGAVLAQGFSSRVLLEIADQLREAMPHVLGGYPMLQAWGFKYDQRMQGINMHADFAKVNVNFWVTPDEACADPATGGMVIYDVPVPQSWTFREYNSDSERLQAYLKVHGAQSQRVPYRANRCVLFDSSLIHVTDQMHFRPGYQNRRVNVTLLYGKARSVE
jgi:hypothetical protein